MAFLVGCSWRCVACDNLDGAYVQVLAGGLGATVGLVPAADWFALVGVGPVGRQRGASLGFAVSGPLVGVRRGVVEGAPWVGWRGGFHGRAELEVHANVAASGCEFVKALVECPALPQSFLSAWRSSAAVTVRRPLLRSGCVRQRSAILSS